MIPFDFSKVSVDTIFTVVTSLFTGVVILYFTKFSEYLKQRRQRKSLKTLSNNNIFKLLKFLYKQSNKFEKYLKYLEIDYLGPTSYEYSIHTPVIILYNLGYEKLYSVYFDGIENFSFNRKQKLNAFNSIWNSVEYINITFNEAKEKAHNFSIINAELNEARNKSIAQSQLIIEEFRIKYNDQYLSKDELMIFWKKREYIISSFTNKGNHLAPTNINNYMEEMLNLNRENPHLLRRYFNDLNPALLNHYLNESNLRYNNMLNFYKSHNSHYKFLAEQYLKNYKSVKKEFRILNKRSYIIDNFFQIKSFIKNNIFI